MENWARAVQAAESTIEDNISKVSKITIWIVSGAVGPLKDHINIHANVLSDDGDVLKFRFEIPPELHDELDTEKAMLGYAVEMIINHLVLPRYFEKFD